MKTVFIATNNKHKLQEFKQIFDLNNFNVEIKTPNDFLDTNEPIENGNTFEENALIKADFYYKLHKLPTIADDSGICIDFYNGGPGIYSARFHNELSNKEKNELIIKEMSNSSNRRATFDCVIAYIDERGNKRTFHGQQIGEIALKQSGEKGFGYDPIFYVPKYNKTEAELGEEYKNRYSHRALALKQWIDYVKTK